MNKSSYLNIIFARKKKPVLLRELSFSLTHNFHDKIFNIVRNTASHIIVSIF